MGDNILLSKEIADVCNTRDCKLKILNFRKKQSFPKYTEYK
jgi:hypothetical protein